jgi:hypothetical protein
MDWAIALPYTINMKTMTVAMPMQIFFIEAPPEVILAACHGWNLRRANSSAGVNRLSRILIKLL